MGLAIILKCISLFVALFGTICAIVLWFLGGFNLGGFTTGVVLLFLNVLIGLAELRPSLWVEKHFAFLLNAFGRALFLVVIGLIFAGDYGLWIACWVIYWVLAGAYLLIYFTGDSIVPNAMNATFKRVPDANAAKGISPQPEQTPTDSAPPPEYPDVEASPQFE
jgi:hypothetical protein